jgi:uncharacterized protein with HEPN domain
MRINAERALSFVGGKTLQQFTEEVLLNYAVVRCLTIIGEAANHVSKAAQAALPQLDWSGMIGLRHVVVHDYGRVDLGEVWEIVHRDLPPLVGELTRYLEKYP